MFSFSLSEKTGSVLFYGFSLLTVASIFLGITIDATVTYVIPFAFLFIWFALFDFKKIYFTLIALIPLTREFSLGALSLDVPGEPVLIILMLIFFFYLLKRKEYDSVFIKHPIIQLLFLHLLWIFVTVFFSYKVLFSAKFFLAKIWYVVTYVFLTGLFVRRLRDFKILFWCVLIPEVFSIIAVLLKHAQSGFSFE